MTNYTQTTFFTPKDSLPITDPNKTIFGAAYDVEYANVAAAIASKIDGATNNPSLVSLNITTNNVPPNGLSLPSANTLGIYSNSTLVGQFAQTTITFFGTAVAAVATVAITNTSTVATQDVLAQLTAGTSIGKWYVANQNRASAVITNGPTAAQAALFTTTAIPLVFGTNGTFAGSFDGTTGGLILGAPTGGQKGLGTLNATGLFINGTNIGTGVFPQVSNAAFNASGIAVGQTFIVFRSATLGISSNTTSAIDPVLQFTNVPVGTYFMNMNAVWQAGANGIGMKSGLTLASGTTGSSWTQVIESNNGGQGAAINQITTSFNSQIINDTGVGVSVFGAEYSAIFTITGTANFGLFWSQSVSSATALTIQIGSYCLLTRVA